MYSKNKKFLMSVAMVGFAVEIGLAGCSFRNKESVQNSNTRIIDLKVNNLENPIAIEYDVSNEPVFSWKMESDIQGQKQTAYEVLIAESEADLDKKKYIFDSGKVESDTSVGIKFDELDDKLILEKGKEYFWSVNVWDKDDKLINAENNAAHFMTGIDQLEWDAADWIYLEADSEQQENTNQDNKYSIFYKMQMEESYTGFVWGADTNCYGEYYVWAFDTREDIVELVASRYEYENRLDEARYALDIEKSDFVNTLHDVRIEVDNTKVTTYLDGEPIADTEVSKAKAVGQIGFWTYRGAYYGHYDDILIKDSNDNVVYQEDFEKEENIFKPFYLKIKDGQAISESGILLTSGDETPAPVFRKCFNIDDLNKYTKKMIYLAALGSYEIELNGKRVSDEYFAPGISFYDKEVYYRAYDLTDYVVEGENDLRVTLAHAHYDRAKGGWGEQIALKGIIRLSDDKENYDTCVTDDTWQVCEGPVIRDDLFWGEYYDANKEIAVDYTWDKNASVLNESVDYTIKASERPPVKSLNRLKPIKVTQMSDGSYVYDFGQNFSGICGVNVKGKKGQVITFRYAEALNTETLECKDDEVGSIWTQNLYTANNTDYYVCKGADNEYFEPSLVCRGFRYVQISGLDYEIDSEDIDAIVLSSDNHRTGYFESSDAKLNRLYSNVFWTQLSNYVGLPTDCPQRDERLGWTGDAQSFARTAAYNYDVYNFLKEYLEALRLAQNEDGSHTDIGYFRATSGGNNGWGDAGVCIVWDLYQQYGDKTIIEENYESMLKYVNYLIDTSENFERIHDGYGDHNAVSTVDITMCNSAQTAYVISLMSKMSAVIGKEDDTEYLNGILKNYQKAWQDKYINEDGSIGEWLQSEYVLGLGFGLYPDGLDASGAEKLNQSVIANNYGITTGYIATKFILPVLGKYGYADTAYKMALKEGYPSWNYMFEHDNNTITEAWATYQETEDGRYGINGSLNHYALGTVGEWFYSDVLGIKTDENQPGYKHFYIEPQIGTDVAWAKGSYESVYGVIEISWEVKDGDVVYKFKIPANTTATVILNENAYHGYKEIELESGEYEIRGRE